MTTQDQTLASIPCTLSGEMVRERIGELAKRGKMPGFQAGVPGALFELDAFGKQLDYRMWARLEGGELRFGLRMGMKVPLILLVAVLITIWPGVWLTDSMLKTYFDWYTIPTWIWYIPLTVIPVPFAWRKSVRESRALAEESGRELVERIRATLADA